MDSEQLEQELLARLDAMDTRLTGLESRIDQLVASHNQVGENIAWIVANTQGIFQMFSDPNIMNQMMSGMLGGMARGGAPSGGQADG